MVDVHGSRFLWIRKRRNLLDGLDWEEHEVFDEAYFFLNEGLGVADTGKEAVVAGGGEGSFATVFFGDE